MWPRKTSYTLLPADNESSVITTDEATEKSTKEYRVGASRAHIIVLYIFTIALAGALCTISILYIDLVKQLKPFQPLRSMACGNTIKEAEANGCTFDLLTKTWLPSTCTRHGEPNFMKIANRHNETQWPYWADEEGREALTLEQVSRMADTEEEWWTTTQEHITSCAWMTIRMAHAYTSGERVDDLAGSFHHIRHCTLLTLGWAYRAPGNQLDQMYKTLGGSKSGFGTC